MKQQFFVTRTIRQTEIHALLDGLQTHLLSKSCIQKKKCFLYFRKNITCLNVGLLRICHVFVCFKIVYRWVTTSCSFIIDIFLVQRRFDPGDGRNFFHRKTVSHLQDYRRHSVKASRIFIPRHWCVISYLPIPLALACY